MYLSKTVKLLFYLSENKIFQEVHTNTHKHLKQPKFLKSLLKTL